MNLRKELIEGKLCEKGYLKERYSEEKNDLVRNITSEGKKRVREIVNTEEGQEEFRKIYNRILESLPEDMRENFSKDIDKMLKGLK